MANPSSRLVLLDEGEGIRELGSPGTSYKLPEGAASLRQIAERASRGYLNGRLLIVTNDLVIPREGLWYDNPAGLADDGTILADRYTIVHKRIDPEKLARAFTRNRFHGDVEYDVSKNGGIVGVYLWRSEPKGPLTVGVRRNPKAGNVDGANLGIGYVHIEKNVRRGSRRNNEVSPQETADEQDELPFAD